MWALLLCRNLRMSSARSVHNRRCSTFTDHQWCAVHHPFQTLRSLLLTEQKRPSQLLWITLELAQQRKSPHQHWGGHRYKTWTMWSWVNLLYHTKAVYPMGTTPSMLHIVQYTTLCNCLIWSAMLMWHPVRHMGHSAGVCHYILYLLNKICCITHTNSSCDDL